MDTSFAIGVGAFVASAIALTITAVASFRQISAQQHGRTAEHRNKWCDEFREEMSDYLSAISLLYDTGDGGIDFFAKSDLKLERERYRAKVRAAEASIGLRLNPVVTFENDLGAIAWDDQKSARADSEREGPMRAPFCPCRNNRFLKGVGKTAFVDTCPLLVEKNCNDLLNAQFGPQGEPEDASTHATGERLEPKFGPANIPWDDLSKEEQGAEASRICAETYLTTCMHKLTRIADVKDDGRRGGGMGCLSHVASWDDLAPKVFEEEIAYLCPEKTEASSDGDDSTHPGQTKSGAASTVDGETARKSQFHACYAGVSGMAKSILKSEWERTKEELGTRGKRGPSDLIWPRCGWVAFFTVAAALLCALVFQFGLQPSNRIAVEVCRVCLIVSTVGAIALAVTWHLRNKGSLGTKRRMRISLCTIALAFVAGVVCIAGVTLIMTGFKDVPFVLWGRTMQIVQCFAFADAALLVSQGLLVGANWNACRDIQPNAENPPDPN